MIGKRMLKLRQAYGESLRDAALRTGVSHTTIARIEGGGVTCSFHGTMRKIADGYKVSIEWLLTGRGEGPVEFDARLRLAAVELGVGASEISAYACLIKKAAASGIKPHVLSLAIDMLLLQHDRIAVGSR